MPELIHTDDLGNRCYWNNNRTLFLIISKDDIVNLPPSTVKALYQAWDNEIEQHTLKHQHHITPQETRNI